MQGMVDKFADDTKVDFILDSEVGYPNYSRVVDQLGRCIEER